MYDIFQLLTKLSGVKKNTREEAEVKKKHDDDGDGNGNGNNDGNGHCVCWLGLVICYVDVKNSLQTRLLERSVDDFMLFLFLSFDLNRSLMHTQICTATVCMRLYITHMVDVYDTREFGYMCYGHTFLNQSSFKSEPPNNFHIFMKNVMLFAIT